MCLVMYRRLMRVSLFVVVELQLTNATEVMQLDVVSQPLVDARKCARAPDTIHIAVDRFGVTIQVALGREMLVATGLIAGERRAATVGACFGVKHCAVFTDTGFCLERFLTLETIVYFFTTAIQCRFETGGGGVRVSLVNAGEASRANRTSKARLARKRVNRIDMSIQ
jgi:hypothetical protein